MATIPHCAALVIEAVPQAMRSLRHLVRHQRGGLTVPQFRVLAFLSRQPEASLAEVAEFIGIKPPTASTMVKTLCKKGLVLARTGQPDRRSLALSLHASGRRMVESAREAARLEMQRRLEGLSAADLAAVERGMRVLMERLSDDPGDRQER